MTLLPFDLFNDETRLIMHDECLYKLKLTYKSEISLKKISPHQREETNTELIKVIRAILFLIKAEKDIPRKISTPCFLACVAVKFWKITLKLGFSKNGTRLKSGHIIDLTLYMKQNRIQRKEFSEANIWVNTEPYLENNHQNKHIQQFGHLGLRQFVINSDESNSSSDVIPYEPSLHSKSAENKCSNNISMIIDRPTENFESFVSLDPLHGQAKPPDQPVTNGHNNISKNIDRPTDNLFENVLCPDSLHGQAKPSDPSSDMILDEVIQTVSVSENLVENPPLSHPPEENNASLQIEATFISSCTQTDTEELDFYTKKPDANSRDREETFSQVHSDHNYFKNKAGNIISNPKEQPIQLQESETSNPNGSSVTDLASSLSENTNNEENRSSVDDEDVRHSSSPEEVSSQTQSDTAVDENVEIVNAESEDGALITNPDTNSNDNDIWGIENKQQEIISEIEIPLPIETRSEYSQDAMTDSSKYGSEITSDQCSSKYPETDEIAEQAFQEEDSSNTEKRDSSPEELKNNQYSKPKTSREMVLKDLIRIKRFKSCSAGDCISPPKVKKENSPKKTPRGKLSTFCAKRISARRKRNKSTPLSQAFISGAKKTPEKRIQTKETPKSQSSISHKSTPQTRERRQPRSKDVTHEKKKRLKSKDVNNKETKNLKSQIPEDEKETTIFLHNISQNYENTPSNGEQRKRGRPRSRNVSPKEKKNPKKKIPEDKKEITIGSNERSQVHEKIPSTGRQRKRGRPRSRNVTPKEKKKLKRKILENQKEITINSNDGSQVHGKTPPIGKQRKRGRPRSRDVTPKEKKNSKRRIPEDQKEITISSNDRSHVHGKTPPIEKQRKRGRPRSRNVTPKEKTGSKSRLPEDDKEIMIVFHNRSQVHKKTPPNGEQRKRGRPRSKDVTPKKKSNPKKRIPKDEKEITISPNDRFQVHKKTPSTGKQRKRGRPRSRNVTPKEKITPKRKIPEDEKEITISPNDRFQVLEKTPPTGKHHKRGRPRSRDVTPKEKTNPKRRTPTDQNEKIVLQNRSQVPENTGKQCNKTSPQSKDITHKEKTNSQSGIPEDQITFGLHDRFQVQTQELQEDLKLQNLAHPSSTSPNKKGCSFMERFRLGYFSS